MNLEKHFRVDTKNVSDGLLVSYMLKQDLDQRDCFDLEACLVFYSVTSLWAKLMCNYLFMWYVKGWVL